MSAFQAHLAAPVPDAELASASLQVRPSGAVTLEITCPGGETSCSGTVTLRTLTAVIAGGGQAAPERRSLLTLASGSFTVPGGDVRAVTLHLSVKARALLARVRTLRARATLLAHDLQGASHSAHTIVTLHAPRAHRRTG